MHWYVERARHNMAGLALLLSAQVDVLVSEWMGYALLFETMLDSVLYARDRFLKPGGAMLPDIASIFIAGASAQATGSPFWKVSDSNTTRLWCTAKCSPDERPCLQLAVTFLAPHPHHLAERLWV